MASSPPQVRVWTLGKKYRMWASNLGMPSTCLMERDDKEGLTINSHLKGDYDNNRCMFA